MIEAFKIILKEKASVRRAEDIARRMRKKIEEGDVPITKENLPQFLKSKIDNISQDLLNLFLIKNYFCQNRPNIYFN